MTKKFRAWDGAKFVSVQKLEFIPAEKSFTGKAGFNINDHLGVPENYVHQWTGLFDKNGREIYEGDIVLCHPQPNSAKTNCEVVSCAGGFRLARLHSKKGVLLGAFVETSGKVETLRVIGNVFENPLDNSKPTD